MAQPATGLIPPPGAAAAHPVAWASYASNGRWKPYKHHRFMGEQLMRLVRGETLRLVVSMPPRAGKSQLLSRYFTSWWLGTHPEDRVILVSMQERLTRRWAREARDDFHQHAEQLWGVTTWSRSSTAEWEIFRNGHRTGGSMSAIGAGGTITGKGAHLLVIDDLIRNLAEAQNDNMRESTWEWFQSACLTRLEPPGRVIILMTRWHHDDLIGRLASLQEKGELGERWEFLNLPAIAEDDDPMGRKPGEALWPERYPVATLERRKRDVGPYVWQSLYQGRPTPAAGAIIKREWFRYYKRDPRTVDVPDHGKFPVDGLYRFATVDLAASKKRRADWTVIAVWGYHPTWKILMLLDVVRERLEGPEIAPALFRAWKAHDLVALYAEREGPWLEEKIGSVLKESAREGVPIVELRPEGDKEARAIAATGAFAAGQVWFPERAPWLAELESELLQFPEGKHDDQVDVATYAVGIFRELVQQGHASDQEDEPVEPGWWDNLSGGEGWDAMNGGWNG